MSETTLRKTKNAAKRMADFLAAVEDGTAVVWCAKVARLNGRGTWNVRVVTVHTSKKFVKVSGGVGFGRDRWVAVSDIQEPRKPRPDPD